MTLTAMTINRYYAIVHPITSLEHRTPKMALLVSVIIWLGIHETVHSLLYRMLQNKNAFGRRPTVRFVIEIKTLTILFWNDFDLKMTLTLITMSWSQQKNLMFNSPQTPFTKVTMSWSQQKNLMFNSPKTPFTKMTLTLIQ